MTKRQHCSYHFVEVRHEVGCRLESGHACHWQVAWCVTRLYAAAHQAQQLSYCATDSRCYHRYQCHSSDCPRAVAVALSHLVAAVSTTPVTIATTHSSHTCICMTQAYYLTATTTTTTTTTTTSRNLRILGVVGPLIYITIQNWTHPCIQNFF